MTVRFCGTWQGLVAENTWGTQGCRCPKYNKQRRTRACDVEAARPLCVKVGCISGSDGNRHLPEGVLAPGPAGLLGPASSPSLAAWLAPAFSICSSWSCIGIFSLAAERFHTSCCSWFGWKEWLLSLPGERRWPGWQEYTPWDTHPSSSLPVEWEHPWKTCFSLTDNVSGLRVSSP